MGKLIIDTTTGTILNAEGCYVVDDTDWTNDDLSDHEIAELAAKSGKSLMKIGSDTGWGDNSYKYTVSYSPRSIKDEADSILEGGVYEEGDREYEALVWAKDADLKDLEPISETIMNQDAVWDGFMGNLTEMLVFVYAMQKEETK